MDGRISGYLNAKSSIAPLTFWLTGDGKELTQRRSIFFLIAIYLQLPKRYPSLSRKGELSSSPSDIQSKFNFPQPLQSLHPCIGSILRC